MLMENLKREELHLLCPEAVMLLVVSLSLPLKLILKLCPELLEKALIHVVVATEVPIN